MCKMVVSKHIHVLQERKQYQVNQQKNINTLYVIYIRKVATFLQSITNTVCGVLKLKKIEYSFWYDINRLLDHWSADLAAGPAVLSTEY